MHDSQPHLPVARLQPHALPGPALALVIAASLLAAPAARATGPCENPDDWSKPTAISQKTLEVAYTVNDVDCDEESGDTTSLKFLRIAPLEGDAERFFLVDKPTEASESLRDLVEMREAGTPEQGQAYLRDNGFVPLEALAKSPTGACEMVRRVVEGEDDEATYNGFPAGALFVELRAGGKLVADFLFDNYAIEEEEELTAQAVFLPKARIVALFLEVPRCEGGPPPGYFGEDDPGECYVEHETAKHVLHAAKKPALAACFAAASTLPTSTNAKPADSGGCASCSAQPDSGGGSGGLAFWLVLATLLAGLWWRRPRA